MCEREFDYNISRKSAIGWSLFFAASATVFAYQCATNDRALELNGIPFTPFGASVFYGIVAGVSVLCVAMGLWLWIRRGRIAFSPEGLLIPKSWWSSAERLLPYRDIRGIRLGDRLSAVTRARLLYVVHKRGSECLSAAMFASEAAFDDFQRLLEEKMREHGLSDTLH